MSKQKLQQKQKQTISFQQIQFFKMLEISQDELEQKIQKEIEENPGKKCYNIKGYFTNNNISYSLNKDIEKSRGF